jgi:diguanylate cyclase (GGDEF)-like protein
MVRDHRVGARLHRLAHLALHDALTDLPNRRLLVDELGAALARARRSGHRVAVLFIDLDDFKSINDNYGHDAGDRLLVEVARRLRRAARAGDTVARISGDEFVVVCEPVRDGHEADAARDRLHVEFDAPVPMGRDGPAVAVRASIGVTVSDDSATNSERLLRDADAAMYHVKRRRHAHVDLVTAELDDGREHGSTGASRLPEGTVGS